MFTSRHDRRIWEGQILNLFPGVTGLTARQLRARIYEDLEAIRQLRNRVAHHEPIFNRTLADDLAKMLYLVELRCSTTASWVRAIERVNELLLARP